MAIISVTTPITPAADPDRGLANKHRGYYSLNNIDPQSAPLTIYDKGLPVGDYITYENGLPVLDNGTVYHPQIDITGPTTFALYYDNGSGLELKWLDPDYIPVEPVSKSEISIFYDTVADMVADSSLIIGQSVAWNGYYSVNDGGGNHGVVVAAATGTNDGGRFFDLASGLQTQAIFADNIASLLQLGGQTGQNSTTAFETGLTFPVLTIPIGIFYIDKVSIVNPINIVGLSNDYDNGSVIKPWDTTGQTSSNTMISIETDNVTMSDIAFDLFPSPNPNDSGLDQGAPYYAIRSQEITTSTGYSNLKFTGLRFRKGRNQLKLENPNYMEILNCTFETADNGWPCATRGGKHLLFDGVVSKNNRTADELTGGGDGIKISTNPDAFANDIKITNCTLINNSRDGIDINLGAGQNIIIDTNYIENNDLTGIEVKKGIESNLVGEDSHYQDVIISNNIIKMADTDRVLINCQNSFFATAIYKNITIASNHLEYIANTGVSSDPAIKLQGVTEALVEGNLFQNNRTGIAVRELGDGTVIKDNFINATIGVQLQTNDVAELEISNNSMRVTERGIDTNIGQNIKILNNSIIAADPNELGSSNIYSIFVGAGDGYLIKGNILYSDVYAIRVDDNFVSDIDILDNDIRTISSNTTTKYSIYLDSGENVNIENNKINTDDYGIRLADNMGDETRITKNSFGIDTQNAVLITAGFTSVGVRIYNNDAVMNINKAFIDNLSVQAIRSYNNVRGDSQTIPVTIGSIGEVVYNSDPTSADYEKWIYTTGGTWQGVGLIT